jgi:hypothetical protein
MRIGFIATVVASCVWCAVARAEDWPRALACTFDRGTSAELTAGAFKDTPAAPLAFEVRDIDIEAQSAALAGKPGAPAGPLRVVRAINANHFIEVLNEGFLGLTTIYDKGPGGTYPAVHSRHIGVVGQPVVAQYTGSCR